MLAAEGFAFNPDAPPPPSAPQFAAATGGSSTIHLHDEDFLLGRLILEYEFDHHTRVVGNRILAGTSGTDLAIGYAFAVRDGFTHKWAAGIEAIGDFNTGGYHQIVVGVIHSPRHDLGLRLGISHGIGGTPKGHPPSSVHLAFLSRRPIRGEYWEFAFGRLRIRIPWGFSTKKPHPRRCGSWKGSVPVAV